MLASDALRRIRDTLLDVDDPMGGTRTSDKVLQAIGVIVQQARLSRKAVSDLEMILGLVPKWQAQKRGKHGGDLHHWSVRCASCVSEAQHLIPEEATCHCALCVERAYKLARKVSRMSPSND